MVSSAVARRCRKQMVDDSPFVTNVFLCFARSVCRLGLSTVDVDRCSVLFQRAGECTREKMQSKLNIRVVIGQDSGLIISIPDIACLCTHRFMSSDMSNGTSNNLSLHSSVRAVVPDVQHPVFVEFDRTLLPYMLQYKGQVRSKDK